MIVARKRLTRRGRDWKSELFAYKRLTITSIIISSPLSPPLDPSPSHFCSSLLPSTLIPCWFRLLPVLSILTTMSNIDLSLDDIIAKTRMNKKIRSQHNPSKGLKTTVRKNEGGVKKRSNWNMRKGGVPTKAVPHGKWKKDKLSRSSIRTLVSSSTPIEVNDNKKVRMNISNLAPTVTTPDLEELFTAYSIESVVVHYGETGEHLGTAEVIMKMKDAQRALNDLKGIAIDGSPIILSIVVGGVGTSIFARVHFSKKVNGGGVQKRSHASSQKIRTGNKMNGGGHPLFRNGKKSTSKTVARGKGGRTTKKTKTEEELDAELESYMKKSEN